MEGCQGIEEWSRNALKELGLRIGKMKDGKRVNEVQRAIEEEKKESSTFEDNMKAIQEGPKISFS